ncbi:MAG: D-aminoacylase [Planctomycetota bacterium]|nr:D-aminoacylase [Planctomycetota bacterium]
MVRFGLAYACRPAGIERIVATCAGYCLLTVTTACLAADPGPREVDLLLRGGILADGTAAVPVVGDLAIQGDRIVAVGRFEGQAALVIDCRGKVVAPGFIDLHNHSDNRIVEPQTRFARNYLTQGCTTIVTGNCGGGKLDVADYLGQIEQHGAGVNVVHLIPQGSLRRRVVGPGKRPPTPPELEQMKRLVSRGMREGAWGMSTGLMYVPGAYAMTAEIVELARVVAAHGGLYASHIRNERERLLESIEEALHIGQQAQLPVHISHFKVVGKPNWGTVRLAAQRITRAREAGQPVTADQYPYLASSTSLEAMLLEPAVRAGGRKAMLARLRDPQQQAQWRKQVADHLQMRGPIQIVSYSPRSDWVGKRLAEIARQENCTAVDVAWKILQTGGAGAVNFGMSPEDVRFVMQLPWVATASDGSVKRPSSLRPHPRSYGTFSRKLGHYRRTERVLSLERAVRSCSGLPADILGIVDRGYLRVGYFADVVVFDPATIADRATYDEPFLESRGLPWVWVNGQQAIHDGQPTDRLAGRPLRHTPPGPDK